MATFTLQALATELATDPLTLGYGAALTDSDKVAILNLRSGLGAANVFRSDVTTAEIINAIVAADFAALTTLQISKLNLILSVSILDTTKANIRTIFLGIFTGMAATITALTALAQRTGSRAEILWGYGTVITEQQVSDSKNL